MADQNYANSKYFKIFVLKAWQIIQLTPWNDKDGSSGIRERKILNDLEHTVEDKRWFNRDIAAYPAELLETSEGLFQCTQITGELKVKI